MPFTFFMYNFPYVKFQITKLFKSKATAFLAASFINASSVIKTSGILSSQPCKILFCASSSYSKTSGNILFLFTESVLSPPALLILKFIPLSIALISEIITMAQLLSFRLTIVPLHIYLSLNSEIRFCSFMYLRIFLSSCSHAKNNLLFATSI